MDPIEQLQNITLPTESRTLLVEAVGEELNCGLDPGAGTSGLGDVCENCSFSGHKTQECQGQLDQHDDGGAGRPVVGESVGEADRNLRGCGGRGRGDRGRGGRRSGGGIRARSGRGGGIRPTSGRGGRGHDHRGRSDQNVGSASR